MTPTKKNKSNIVNNVNTQNTKNIDTAKQTPNILKIKANTFPEIKETDIYRTGKQVHKQLSGLDNKGSLVSIFKVDYKQQTKKEPQPNLFDYTTLQQQLRLANGKLETKFLTILSYIMFNRDYLGYNKEYSTYTIDLMAIVKTLYPTLKPTKTANKIKGLLTTIEKIQKTTYKRQTKTKIDFSKNTNDIIQAFNIISSYEYNNRNKLLNISINPFFDFQKNYDQINKNYFKINYKNRLEYIDATHENDNLSRFLLDKIITYPATNKKLKINIEDIENALPQRANTIIKKIETLKKSFDLLKEYNYILEYEVDLKDMCFYFEKNPNKN